MNFQQTARYCAGLAACLLVAAAAHAGAPQIKSQAPGYYRMNLGDFEVTALCDGTFQAPLDKLLTLSLIHI